MIAFAVDGPTPGSDSSNVASAVLTFTIPEAPGDEPVAVGAEELDAAAIACGTVATVGFVRRTLVVGGCTRDATTERGGTYT